MPKLTVDLTEATRRHLDEVAALTGSETGEALVARLLDRHQAFWEYVEVGRQDIREGRCSDGEEFFDKLLADLDDEIAVQEQVAAE